MPSCVLLHPRVSFRTLLVAATLSAASFVSAQTPGTGAITGIVTDPQHHRVGSADVEAINETTGMHRLTHTEQDGFFRLPLLTPGEWELKVHADGFADQKMASVVVTTGDTKSVAVELAVAGVSSTIEVSALQAVVQTDSSTLGGLVNREAVNALPLSNRNYTQILALSPGIVVDLPSATQLG